MKIFRPVLTYDKKEIIAAAKEIGTYEISKGPEICNLLGPKNPATKTEIEVIRKELENIDFKRVLNENIQAGFNLRQKRDNCCR